jgi:hypothetical protein
MEQIGSRMSQTNTVAANAGFQPAPELSQPASAQSTETGETHPLEQDGHDATAETAEELQERTAILGEISKLVSRYPELRLRSNSELLASLDEYDLLELKNIYMNAMNDVQDIRGNEIIMNSVYYSLRNAYRNVTLNLHHILFYQDARTGIGYTYVCP